MPRSKIACALRSPGCCGTPRAVPVLPGVVLPGMVLPGMVLPGAVPVLTVAVPVLTVAVPVLTVADASRLPIRSQTAVAIFVPPKSKPRTTGGLPTMTCHFPQELPGELPLKIVRTVS